MKKKIVLLTMLLLFCFAGTAYATDVTVMVDGKELPQKGVIVDGRTMVPIRDIAEAVGIDVIFDNSLGNNRVELQKDGIMVGQVVGNSYTVVKLQPLGNGQYRPNYQIYESDVEAQNINGKSMVPLKIISEILDTDISWDGTNRVASVTSKQSVVSEDGKIDLMSGIGAHERKGIMLKDAGFEVVSLTAEREEYGGSGYYITCRFKNVTNNSFSGTIYLDIYDKKTGKWIKGSDPLYEDAWKPEYTYEMSVFFSDFNPQLHEVDIIMVGEK